MYKVFFKDKIVVFSDNLQVTGSFTSGLFYKYGNKRELKELVYMFFNLEQVSHFHIIHHDIDELRNSFSSCFKQIKASGGLVKNSKGEFLIVKRNDIWDLPKGKNEPGESAKQAAIREVNEECGINNLKIIREITKTYHTYILNDKPILKETTGFEMITTANNIPVPQTDENISEVRWVNSGNTDFIVENTYSSIIEVLKEGGIL